MAKAWQFVACGLLLALVGCERGPGIQVGDTLPIFAVANVKDPIMKIDSSAYQGRPTIIDFWATWCPPCRAELPHLEELWAKYKDRGLKVVAVTQDDLNTVNAFRSETKLELPMYLDADGAMSKLFGVSGLPTTLVINRDGKVIYKSLGYDQSADAEMDAAVEQAL